jgi:hypothetical protein
VDQTRSAGHERPGPSPLQPPPAHPPPPCSVVPEAGSHLTRPPRRSQREPGTCKREHPWKKAPDRPSLRGPARPGRHARPSKAVGGAAPRAEHTHARTRRSDPGQGELPPVLSYPQTPAGAPPAPTPHPGPAQPAWPSGTPDGAQPP